jgi:hypothetical protein
VKYLSLVIALVVASPAAAQSLEAECASSFPARLQDAKQALAQWDDDHPRYIKARPLVEYFEGHCRFLSDRERAARKLDDANAFVCDAPKPKGLTAELVLRYSVEPSIGAYQAHAGANNRCLELDRGTRVALVFTGAEDLDDVARRLLAMCYGDERPSCERARASLAAAKR